MKVNIATARIIDYACVEVIGKIGTYRSEYVVYFSNNEKDGERIIEGGYQFLPMPETYCTPEALPAPVRAAATEAYAARTSKENQTKFPMR